MKKGVQRKKEIQKVFLTLCRQKGYPNVSMSEIGKACRLSQGGLYHHYHSVEEILLDAFSQPGDDLILLFDAANDIYSLILAFHRYFILEKADLLAEGTAPSILYPYYFSFPEAQRKEKMQKVAEESLAFFSQALGQVFSDQTTICFLARHIYLTLQGFNLLAMSQSLSEDQLDAEILELERMMLRMYEEQTG